MASSKMWTLVAVCLVLTMSLYEKVEGQPGCTSALMGLAPCLGYISGSSPTPGTTCCSQLQSVVKTQANCLCQVLNGSSGASSFGVSFNQTQALQLPGACKVATPPISQCNAAAAPAGSPTGSPTDAASSHEAGSVTPNTPSTPTVSSIPSPTGSGSGSKSTTGSTSAGNMNKFSMHFTILLLIFTSTAFAVTSL
ncbi:hypothetical protein RND81_13G143100 [Saponaria officinalis]|uniref:Bifunctional inhibitor/plant lipid transfer protein/seed storage helical domain-containing protein n=1 Tax=Saponaria officinalis TaxID=3572 RepID=A0AAW1H0K8_SAPOF